MPVPCLNPLKCHNFYTWRCRTSHTITSPLLIYPFPSYVFFPQVADELELFCCQFSLNFSPSVFITDVSILSSKHECLARFLPILCKSRIFLALPLYVLLMYVSVFVFCVCVCVVWSVLCVCVCVCVCERKRERECAHAPPLA